MHRLEKRLWKQNKSVNFPSKGRGSASEDPSGDDRGSKKRRSFKMSKKFPFVKKDNKQLDGEEVVVSDEAPIPTYEPVKLEQSTFWQERVLALDTCMCSTCSIRNSQITSMCTYSETCLVRTSKGTQNQYLLSGLVYVHEVYTGTERGVLTIQEYVLNQVLTIRVGLCT